MKQVLGGTGCQCDGYSNDSGNEQGSIEGSDCQPCKKRNKKIRY
ncbi:hypothetical protein [Aquimarina latercula]|nr:hypothetical protein [Aquimarina latercula]